VPERAQLHSAHAAPPKRSARSPFPSLAACFSGFHSRLRGRCSRLRRAQAGAFGARAFRPSVDAADRGWHAAAAHAIRARQGEHPARKHAAHGCLPRADQPRRAPFVTATFCDAHDCAGGAQGCPVFLYAKSGERPATATPVAPFPPPAANDEDGKDHGSLGIQTSGNNPTLALDQKFDLLVPVHSTISITFPTTSTTSCYLYGHLTDDSADPIEMVVPITLPLQADGELSAQVGSISFPSLALNSTGCGPLGALAGAAFGAFLPSLQNFITAQIQPTAAAALQAVIPSPAGVAGVFDMTASLKPYTPPPGVNLEFLALAGGYASAANGGLNIGVIAGMNSDSDETTRDGGLASEPSTCVPHAVVPDLSAPPWALPYNAAQKDFLISPLDAFTGTSDPTIGLAPSDLLLGVSQAFLGLAAAHAANSGALCPSIGGANLPALTSGALSVLVDSTGSVYGDRRAALTAVVHPGGAPQVTLGVGSASDPFVHVAFPKLGFDLNVGSPATPVLSATSMPTLRSTSG
jgi:hypothetical protein